MRKFLDIIALLATLVGLALSIVSWLEICTTHCAAMQHYRLFSFKFQTIGLLFFPILLISHLLAFRLSLFRVITGLLLGAAVGAEIMFILLQKYTIQQWCPVCLGIAGTVGVAAVVYLVHYLMSLNRAVEQESRGDIMRKIWQGGSSFLVTLLSFLAVFFGVTKIDPLEAKEDSIKEAMVFGLKDAPVEIYLFTDWQCPACRKLEPEVDNIVEAVTPSAQFYFADYMIHPETLNFIPYNLSFLINNKQDYLPLRHMLSNLSKKTGEPTHEQIESGAKALGQKYTPLNYADVVVGRQFFKHVAKEFNINATPTLVIVNRDTKKGKKLYGARDISTENVQKAIKELETP